MQFFCLFTRGCSAKSQEIKKYLVPACRKKYLKVFPIEYFFCWHEILKRFKVEHEKMCECVNLSGKMKTLVIKRYPGDLVNVKNYHIKASRFFHYNVELLTQYLFTVVKRDEKMLV